MRRFILLVDIRSRLREYAATLDVEPSFDDVAAPTLADCEYITHLLSGTPDASTFNADNDVPSASRKLIQSTRRTPSGRLQHIYTFDDDKWAEIFRELQSIRANELGPEAKCSFLRGNPPRVVGHEQYPGRLFQPRRISQPGHPKPKTSYTLVMHDDIPARGGEPEVKWPLDKYIKGNDIISCLKAHLGLAYATELKQDAELWSNPESNWCRSPLDKKINMLTAEKGFSVTSTIEVYDALMLGGEMYGSAIASRRYKSSYVAVVGPSIDGLCPNIVKYGQVQFYFSIVHAGVTHDFAVMHYFSISIDKHYWVEKLIGNDPETVKQQNALNKDERRRKIDEAYPLVNPTPLAASRWSIIPVQTIRNRWIPCPRPVMTTKSDIWWQVCPIPSRMHA